MDQKFSRRVDRGIPTVDIEFRSGFPLWTQHHCVISSKTTVPQRTVQAPKRTQRALIQNCYWFSVNRKYFIISCICAQKQYVDFRSTAGYPVQGIRLSLLCVQLGGRSAGVQPRTRSISADLGCAGRIMQTEFRSKYTYKQIYAHSWKFIKLSFYCRIEKSLTVVDLTAGLSREIWHRLNVWSNVCGGWSECRAGVVEVVHVAIVALGFSHAHARMPAGYPSCRSKLTLRSTIWGPEVWK